MKYIYLSHFLENELPVYGNSRASLNLEPCKSIAKGDSANVFCFTMENHWGTHMDAPAHFFDGAPSLADYPPWFWFFEHPQPVHVPAGENELIGVEHLERCEIGAQTDLLLVKTGFQSLRGKEAYSTGNPGMSAEAGAWLRKGFPSMRAVGFDFISLSPHRNRDEGRRAHRAFLDPNAAGTPVLVIEDMNLEGDLNALRRVIVLPLLIKGADSAPCTVIGALG